MSMVVGGAPWRVGILVAGLVLSASATVSAEELTRVDWTPGGGRSGDLWTFNCPVGGSLAISVDVLDDRPQDDGSFASALDPIIDIFDGEGNYLGGGDAEFECSVASSCDAACPAVEFPCGDGLRHSVTVRDTGFLSSCTGGGTYVLRVEVLDESGESLANPQVQLGGGPPRDVPPFLIDFGIAGRRGPAVDNGPTPFAVTGVVPSPLDQQAPPRSK
jgi:hypothetical protein